LPAWQAQIVARACQWLAHIAIFFGLAAGQLFDHGDAAFAGGLVDVADAGDIGGGDFVVELRVILAAAAEADQCDVHPLIGSADLCGGKHGGGGEEGAAGHFA
jgi:hypothetical protein